MRRPFFRPERNGWYIRTGQRGKTQRRLGDTEDEALQAWAEMIAAQKSRGSDATIAAVAEEFLTLTEGKVSPETFSQRGRYLADFCSVYGYTKVADIRPVDVLKWIAAHPKWGNASERAAISTVKRALNWAVRQGLIQSHPLVLLEKPEGNRREHLISDSEHRSMMTAADSGRKPGKRLAKIGRRPVRRDACFRQVLIALKHSGTRPGMIAAARIEQLSADLSTLTISQHKTRKKTGRPLVIYLSPCLQTVIRLAIAGRSSGPIFRDSRGKPWTTNAIRCRMRRLREKLKLPAGVVAYSFRHTFATNAIVAGNDAATVAELLGHRDVGMIQRYYGHLDQRKDHLIRAVTKAVSRSS